MVGKFQILGDIGSYIDEMGNEVKGVDLTDIVAKVKDLRAEGALSFEVEIDSNGGFCDVGFDIYDYLVSIPEEVTTIAVNKCASIATVIFLAGNRRLAKCALMIHNPWLSNIKGDADDVQEAADAIRAEEDKLISFYAKHTGIEKIALDALMKQETYIYPDMAQRLGFTTELDKTTINTPFAYKAVAKLKDNMAEDTKKVLSKMDLLLNKMHEFMGKKPEGSTKPKALLVTDGSGKALEIINADGSDITSNPSAGNLVMIEGAPAPDGQYELPELNVVVSVLMGAITEVKEMEMNKDLETALAEIEKLTASNKTLMDSLEETKKDNELLSNKFSDIEKTLATITGKSQEFQTQNRFRKEDEKEVKGLAKNIDARREELKAKREVKK